MMRLRWMKPVLCGCLMGLGLSGLARSAQEDGRPPAYTFGVVPQFEARQTHAVWMPILNDLEKRTGYGFKLVGAPTIPDFEREFMNGDFDFAYMNPYHLVVANQTQGYQPLVRDISQSLTGILVARKDGAIHDPSELGGQIVAFPAPNALGASLQIRQELHDRFGLNIKPRYVKTHDSVYLNVLLGEAAAGGGVDSTLEQQRQEVRDALIIIHRTVAAAPHPISVHPRVPETVRERVSAALLAMGADPETRGLLNPVPIRQIGTASLADYEPLKQMGLERFYVQPN